MTDLAQIDAVLRQLRAPVRNRYFYGKLLDVRHLEMEQDYDITMRWLLNRLSLGTGVLCGLEVTLGRGGLLIGPGVAIDGLGREIVVPAAYCVTDPGQPTDADGRPAGDRVVGGAVTVFLCYTECPADPTPVLVGDCDSANGFAPGSTVQRFSVVVRAGGPATAPGLTERECGQLLPNPPPADPDLRLAACQLLAPDCAPPDEICVPLVRVAVGADGKPAAVDRCGPRTTLYSNARLFDVLSCLADRFLRCCAQTTLRYVAGDAQQGAPRQELPTRLQVEVVDLAGNTVDGVEVSFHVQAGGGRVTAGGPAADRVVVPSASGGRAAVAFTLGAQVGPASVEATLATGARVVFTAWGTRPEEPPPPAHPPVVLGLRPAPAEVLDIGDGDVGSRWAEAPELAVTFDREMDQANLRAADDWLRLWFVTDPGELKTVQVTRVRLELVDVTAGDVVTARYRVDAGGPDAVPIADAVPIGGLVLMRAEGTAIMSAGPDPLLLDAEFAGTATPPEVLAKVWDVSRAVRFPRALWDGMSDTGARLPRSGDGVPGGLFHSWFALIRRG